MGVIGNMQTFTQFNIANSIPDAAKNPGGVGAIGAGLGMGMAMATPIGQAISGQTAGGSGTPPPIPGENYFVAVNGQQTGPFDMQTLATQASAGRLTQQSLVWTHGMAQWTPAGQVPALASIFANVPPPLPPNS
jgi:membrane protease subunit (stomatin/prohibitin family)